MEKLIIVGTSTTGKHVYEFIKYHNLYDIIGFAVNAKYKTRDTFCNLPVYELENLNRECHGIRFKVFIAMLWNKLNKERKEVYQFCIKNNYQLANLISPLAVIKSEIKGNNCWIHDFVVVQNDANIGSDVFIMAHSLIGADTNIGDHCFFAAKSLLGGGSIVGEQSFIGLNATIFDDTKIGNKCIIGACTAVKRNLPDYSKCITASDNNIIKQYNENEIEDKLMFSKNVR